LDDLSLDNWRYIRARQVLKEYRQYDCMIKLQEESIRHPHKPDDYASDRRGTKTTPETATETLYSVATDRKILWYRKAKRSVEQLLSECDEDTATIINELFITKFPRYTLNGLVQQQKVSCGRNKAIEKRKRFFKELDNLLEE
jgi:RinA family phage transcriptional activator